VEHLPEPASWSGSADAEPDQIDGADHELASAIFI
jgi:hypothetical protein